MTTIVYIANADSHDITVLALDAASGELHEQQRFATGGIVMPLAASPDGRVLHASIRTEPHRVLSLAIDPASGMLSSLGSAPLPASSCWISTDRGGRFLLSASYGGNSVAVSPIDAATGCAGAAQQVVPTEPNAHCICLHASNRYAFAPCLGGDVVRQWRFDASTGRLEDNGVPAWHARPGSGPRHLAFHPHAPFAYLLGEHDAGIDVLALDERTGTLSHVQTASAWPAGAAGAPWAADIHLTPDGRFLFACERRTSTIAAFAVDAGSGRIERVDGVATEAQPRSFAISPDGRFLFAAGQVSHCLSRYAVDAGSGTLDKLGDQAVGTNPNWIEIVELAA